MLQHYPMLCVKHFVKFIVTPIFSPDCFHFHSSSHTSRVLIYQDVTGALPYTSSFLHFAWIISFFTHNGLTIFQVLWFLVHSMSFFPLIGDIPIGSVWPGRVCVPFGSPGCRHVPHCLQHWLPHTDFLHL